jgi:hypothetical protein
LETDDSAEKAGNNKVKTSRKTARMIAYISVKENLIDSNEQS